MGDVDVFDVANVYGPLLAERISDEIREVAGVEEAEDIMGGILGPFGLAMQSGVLVDLLAEFAEDSFALGDVLEEGRLDMIHSCGLNNFNKFNLFHNKKAISNYSIYFKSY